ncbi:MAG: alpha/beta hydrolase [Cyclobacteriaceae bacterium]
MGLIDHNIKMKNFSSYLIILSCIVAFACNTDLQKNSESEEKVYLNYTEAAIDSAYNQSFWAPNRQYIFSQLQALRELSQSKIGTPERIQYGDSSIEQLDLYSSKLANAPIHIFIHGGAWRAGNGSGNTAYNARKFVESGMLYIAPDYQLATDANGSLYPMVDQLRKVVVWTYQNAARFGGNPDSIFLSGHSAGGHLGGVLITTDWTEYGLPADVIKGAFLSSGMYDLYPVSLSSRNEYVEFTDKMVEDLSPINHIAKIRTPVILAYGTQESPEFKRQSRLFAEALKKQSKEIQLHVLEGYNHFEIIIALGNPYNVPGELMIKQMNID